MLNYELLNEFIQTKLNKDFILELLPAEETFATGAQTALYRLYTNSPNTFKVERWAV